MTYKIPTLPELLTRVQTDLGGFSDGTVPPDSVEYGLAQAEAAGFKGLYGYQSWRFKQQFPSTAEETYFWKWASFWGIFQKQAVAWRGLVEFTGTDGEEIPAGSELQRADGKLYTTDEDVTVDGGVAEVGVTATDDYLGDDANNVDGQVLSFSTPIPGVDTDGTVQETTQSGSDLETPEDALPRLLLRTQNGLPYGQPGSYVIWALQSAGVTRAWEFPLYEGPNSYSIVFVRDGDAPEDEPATAAIIPDSTERDAVLADLETLRPGTVTVTILAAAAQTVSIVLSSLTPNTAEVRQAIKESVADLLYREGGPGKTIPLSRVDAAVSNATGEEAHTMTTPSTDIVSTELQVPIVGTVTVVP